MAESTREMDFRLRFSLVDLGFGTEDGLCEEVLDLRGGLTDFDLMASFDERPDDALELGDEAGDVDADEDVYVDEWEPIESL